MKCEHNENICVPCLEKRVASHQNKNDAINSLIKAEMRYLHFCGWLSYCGTKDNRFMEHPDNKGVFMTTGEAVAKQRLVDKF
jgi:hypothetical protein